MSTKKGRARFAIFAALVLACGSALAVGSDINELDNDPIYRDARRLIATHDYAGAIPKLETLLKDNPTSPALLNWLGFSHRKLKNYPASKQFYDAALKSDPTFLEALEYQGEWYLETGDMASAKANLVRLGELCGKCHEWKDLSEAIAKAEGK
ncbi:MAG: tetratricopeptide repeat protein [Bosea sp. (in: a-proteobacteria)]